MKFLTAMKFAASLSLGKKIAICVALAVSLTLLFPPLEPVGELQVTDEELVRMGGPDLDAAELLAEVRKRQPTRISITGVIVRLRSIAIGTGVAILVLYLLTKPKRTEGVSLDPGKSGSLRQDTPHGLPPAAT